MLNTPVKQIYAIVQLFELAALFSSEMAAPAGRTFDRTRRNVGMKGTGSADDER